MKPREYDFDHQINLCELSSMPKSFFIYFSSAYFRTQLYRLIQRRTTTSFHCKNEINEITNDGYQATSVDTNSSPWTHRGWIEVSSTEFGWVTATFRFVEMHKTTMFQINKNRCFVFRFAFKFTVKSINIVSVFL